MRAQRSVAGLSQALVRAEACSDRSASNRDGTPLGFPPNGNDLRRRPFLCSAALAFRCCDSEGSKTTLTSDGASANVSVASLAGTGTDTVLSRACGGWSRFTEPQRRKSSPLPATSSSRNVSKAAIRGAAVSSAHSPFDPAGRVCINGVLLALSPQLLRACGVLEQDEAQIGLSSYVCMFSSLLATSSSMAFWLSWGGHLVV
mmetsp:Transcript_50519/g.100857  ORF Transcript_50519/g.100857 Transcript_50519/m.100857 type:complete len:202 (+) Transcript_50519:452-1057(+)